MISKLKKHIFVFLVVFLIFTLFILTSCSSKKLTEADNNKSVEMKLNEILTVTLESNITTGYDWSIGKETDLNILAVASDQYKPSGENLAGAGGIHIFKFKAISSGKTQLVLNYVRPWETGVAPESVYIINVDVK